MIDFHYDYNWKYPFSSIKSFFGDFFRDIKWFFQRGARGYADKDIWDFDWYLSQVISNGLKQLKENKGGYPCSMNEDSKKAERNWDRDLQIMIDGFRAANEIAEDSFMDDCLSKTQTIDFCGDRIPALDYTKYKHEEKTRQIKLNKAMDLFKKHFFSLWD